MKNEPTMEVTSDFTKDFNDIVRRFKRDAVLVGIPEDDSQRDEPDAPISNAALLALNNFGSAANNIPARPVMQLGLQKCQDEVAQIFRDTAVKALKIGFEALSPGYNRAGIVASNSIKKVINSQEGFDAPAPATLEARKAKGFKGTKALIVTGQMRNAITYVVKGEG